MVSSVYATTMRFSSLKSDVLSSAWVQKCYTTCWPCIVRAWGHVQGWTMSVYPVLLLVAGYVWVRHWMSGSHSIFISILSTLSISFDGWRLLSWLGCGEPQVCVGVVLWLVKATSGFSSAPEHTLQCHVSINLGTWCCNDRGSRSHMDMNVCFVCVSGRVCSARWERLRLWWQRGRGARDRLCSRRDGTVVDLYKILDESWSLLLLVPLHIWYQYTYKTSS